MQELRESVRKLIDEELERANKNWPMFRSDHEGVAVVDEEFYETAQEYTSLYEAVQDLEKAIYTDAAVSQSHTDALDIEFIATELACEAIQVAAMGRKFIESREQRKELEG